MGGRESGSDRRAKMLPALVALPRAVLLSVPFRGAFSISFYRKTKATEKRATPHSHPPRPAPPTGSSLCLGASVAAIFFAGSSGWQARPQKGARDAQKRVAPTVDPTYGDHVFVVSSRVFRGPSASLPPCPFSVLSSRIVRRVSPWFTRGWRTSMRRKAGVGGCQNATTTRTPATKASRPLESPPVSVMYWKSGVMCSHGVTAAL